MEPSKIEEFLNENLDFSEGCQDQTYYYHFKLGLDSYSSNQHEDALKHFEASLRIAKGLTNQILLEFFAYYGLGYSYASNSLFGQTIDCFHKCLNLSEGMKSNSCEKCFGAFAYIAFGDAALFIGDSEAALTFFKAALVLAAGMHDEERELVGYRKLADTYKILKKYPKALEQYQKCLGKMEGMPANPTFLRERFQAHQGFGDVCKVIGQFYEAMNHYQESLKILSKFTDDDDSKYERLLIYEAMGYSCVRVGLSTLASVFYDECLKINLNLKNKSIEARIHLGLGYSFVSTGNCFEATTNFQNSLEIATKISDKHLEAASTVGLGDVCMLSGEHSSAMEYYEQSLDIATECKLHDIEIVAYLGLGNACVLAGRSSEGLEHLDKCLNLSVEVGDRYNKCRAHLGLGDIEILEKRYELAVAQFQKGLGIAKEIGARNCESRARRSLADAEMSISKTDDVVGHYNFALKIAEETGNAYEKSRSHLGLGKVYKSMKNYEKSWKHYEKGFTMAASLSGRNLQTRAEQRVDHASTDEHDQLTLYMEGLPFAHMMGNQFRALSGYWELGDVCYNLKKFDKAIRLFERCLEIAEETEDLIDQHKAYERLINIYNHQGRNYMVKQFQEKLQMIAAQIENCGSQEAWKWEESSKVHREKFIKLLDYGRDNPNEIKDINGVRVCCSTDFCIGKGGEGTRVYIGLGKDGYERAVKRLPKDTCVFLAEHEKRVLNELKTSKSDHVVNYWSFDDEKDKDYLYLILDLCEETLEEFVGRSDLDELKSVAKDILEQILKGLADLHGDEGAILHRDLKPSNILRNAYDKWLLSDFGISRILTGDSSSHLSQERGTKHWRAVESYPLEGEDEACYKKESDIQVAGMVAFYIVTKGGHPFGEERHRLDNLLKGKPVGLDALKDPVLKDLLSWMLNHEPKDRPSAKEALRHPYLQTKRLQFEMVCKVGNEYEIKTQDTSSDVVKALNSDTTDWRSLMHADVLTYLSTDLLNGKPKVFNYGSSWTECLRLIRNVNQHWYDRPRPKPQPEAFYLVGDPEEYFLNTFPGLPLVVHKAIRSRSEWKTRPELKNYFTGSS